MTAPVSVEVSDSGPAPGRRGIDASKVRTIEEVQGDAPPVRASSSKAGMQDDRIALLRSPLPETNKGRKPGSRSSGKMPRMSYALKIMRRRSI